MNSTINRRPQAGFTIIELLVVVAILVIIMSMVGYIMVKAIELKSVSENRLDDLIGGLAAGRLLERDLRHMPDYADPAAMPGSSIFSLQSVTIDGKANQPVLYLKTTPDRFDRHNGDAETVRWFVKGGVLYREVYNEAAGTWLDLDTALDLDLQPFEVLRGVAWLVDNSVDPSQLDITAAIYPSMNAWQRIEVLGEPPVSLANNERPRSVHFQFQVSRVALANKRVEEGTLWP